MSYQRNEIDIKVFRRACSDSVVLQKMQLSPSASQNVLGWTSFGMDLNDAIKNQHDGCFGSMDDKIHFFLPWSWKRPKNYVVNCAWKHI